MDSVGIPAPQRAAFFDELEKIAICRSRMTVAQSRKGRRPMHVDTLLKKEKEGTLYKFTKAAKKDKPKTAGRVR